MFDSAKWIWKRNENNENTWMCFVKKAELKNIPRKVIARISTDSKYWLYINGKMAVFEGGIKRGPSKHETYYDEVDLTQFFQSGVNTIAVLVWFYGKNGFSHLSSGQGGFLFEADLGSMVICSDDTWKIRKNPAYVEADEADFKANFRLPESNLYFDAAKDMGAWYAPDYDTDSWEQADIVGAAGEGAWGKLRERMIPQWKDYGLKEYVNSAEWNGFTAKEDTVLSMCLPYNAQITPYLKIDAPAGKRIGIKADNYDDLLYDTKSVMAVYYAKDGFQEYESLGWMNGEKIFYSIPAGVTVHELKYRETGYDTEFAGEFVSDDEFLNKLWQKSIRTLYITMRDTFMDCPDRERVQWWGDVNVEMQMMMYGLDEKAHLLYKKGVDSMAGWAEDTGSMFTVVPSGTELFELPMQNLAGIWGFWHYYGCTGDRFVPERAYLMSRRYLLDYEMGSDGMVVHKKGSWDWPDWGSNSDIAPMENAWYYMALTACRNMAEFLGHTEDIPAFEKRLESIWANYDCLFWKGEYYYGETENGKPDDRANALAVLAGLADEQYYPRIKEVLCSTENSSPYMEKYVLDALCEMGYIDDAVKRMKKRYREMVGYEYSTLWEYWNKDGTLNHAWSGGPLVTMSKYIAGVRPTDTAYRTFEIKPHMGDLKYVRCRVPSAKGIIDVEIRREETEESAGNFQMDVTVPKGATAEVYLPVPENSIESSMESSMVSGVTKFSQTGSAAQKELEYTLEEGYAKFTLTEGHYHLQ